MFRCTRGFTLIELSIVLIVIGLIVGGVLAGEGLIRAQQARRVMTDAKSHMLAIQQFKTQYEALPGDMLDAARIWGNAEGGAVTANCATPTTSASNGAATCNGNGNGTIDGGTESYRAWQQMAAAGFIGGSYTGIPGTSGNLHAVMGTNSPVGPLLSTGFFLWSWGIFLDGDTTYWGGDYNNSIMFGTATATSWPSTAALTGKEAAEIDKKSDDGLPGQGSVRAPTSTFQAGCASTSLANTAVYLRNSTSNTCILFFLSSYQAPAN